MPADETSPALLKARDIVMTELGYRGPDTEDDRLAWCSAPRQSHLLVRLQVRIGLVLAARVDTQAAELKTLREKLEAAEADGRRWDRLGKWLLAGNVLAANPGTDCIDVMGGLGSCVSHRPRKTLIEGVDALLDADCPDCPDCPEEKSHD